MALPAPGAEPDRRPRSLLATASSGASRDASTGPGPAHMAVGRPGLSSRFGRWTPSEGALGITTGVAVAAVVEMALRFEHVMCPNPAHEARRGSLTWLDPSRAATSSQAPTGSRIRRGPGGFVVQEADREAHLPAQQPSARQAPRLPASHVDPSGPGRAEDAAAQGSPQAVSLTWRVRDRQTFVGFRRSRPTGAYGRGDAHPRPLPRPTRRRGWPTSSAAGWVRRWSATGSDAGSAPSSATSPSTPAWRLARTSSAPVPTAVTSTYAQIEADVRRRWPRLSPAGHGRELTSPALTSDSARRRAMLRAGRAGLSVRASPGGARRAGTCRAVRPMPSRRSSSTARAGRLARSSPDRPLPPVGRPGLGPGAGPVPRTTPPEADLMSVFFDLVAGVMA